MSSSGASSIMSQLSHFKRDITKSNPKTKTKTKYHDCREHDRKSRSRHGHRDEDHGFDFLASLSDDDDRPSKSKDKHKDDDSDSHLKMSHHDHKSHVNKTPQNRHLDSDSDSDSDVKHHDHRGMKSFQLREQKPQKDEKTEHKHKTKPPSPLALALQTRYELICRHPDQYPNEQGWIAPKNATGVKYICYVGSTGYADAAKGYIRSLVESGCYVYLEPVRYCDAQDGQQLTSDDNLLSVCLHNDHIKYQQVIIHSTPTDWPRRIATERERNPKVHVYGLTVWETDRVDPHWMEIIDQNHLDGLIVPSQWNAKTFYNTADHLNLKHFPPVSVCHHIITDRPRMTQENSAQTVGKGEKGNREKLYGPNRKLVILCIGTWTCRKGIDETVKAYLSAFTEKDSVVLYLKTSDGHYSSENDEKLRHRLNAITGKIDHPAEIILDTQLRSDDYIDDLVTNCDVYLSLCNSEGVGLGACQAALKGKIIVMTGYGGQVEYIKEAIWIQYQLGPVQVPETFVSWIRPPQQWAYPNLEHAVQTLKEIYLDPSQYQNKAEVGRSFIMSHFTPKNQGNILKKILSLS